MDDALTTATRRDALLAVVRRELDRRPWIEAERHLETITLVIRLDRDGDTGRCVIRTESAC